MLNGNVWRTRVVRFFLSLDEFLPGVDLGLARLWQISQDFVSDAALLSFSQDQRLDPGAHRPGGGLFAV